MTVDEIAYVDAAPAIPDRTDAVARVLTAYEQDHEDAGSEAWPEADDYARAILTTDDPAAVAAIAATLAERHPEALLDALTNAGVLTAERNSVTGPCGCTVHSSAIGCGCKGEERWGKRRLVTVWREVQQP